MFGNFPIVNQIKYNKLQTHDLTLINNDVEMKKVLWEGTENWNQLLHERAAISGKLALSEETKLALQKFKKWEL
mgnify:CR=1 FL=1